jgi:long-chain acyl-CoA synthetase
MSMIGTVGPPVPNIDVHLESVPEMDYDALSSRARGEICIRGETLFSGYYKRDDLTKEVLVDGWFHTGRHYSISILLLCLFNVVSAKY